MMHRDTRTAQKNCNTTEQKNRRGGFLGFGVQQIGEDFTGISSDRQSQLKFLPQWTRRVAMDGSHFRSISFAFNLVLRSIANKTNIRLAVIKVTNNTAATYPSTATCACFA
jgi:hypothetical protein